jgi:hypothetical protein
MADHHDETSERTTFRALLSATDFATLDAFKLDTYGDGIDGIENGDSISYGKVDPVNNDVDADAVGHRSLVGSDYSGGSLIRANLKAFRALVEEETGEGEPLPIVDTYGGHGTDGVLILLDREADEEKLRPFVELLQGLENYPCVCEDTLSHLEHEEENEAWQDFAEGDFAKALANRIGQDVAEIEDPETEDSVSLRDLFSAVADSANLNGGPGVIHETDGVYIMTDDAAAAVSPVLLFALGFVKLDPDAMLELAASTDPDDHDNARRIYRLSRLGLGLRQARDFLAREIETRATVRAMPEDGRLSQQASDSIRAEAKRQEADLILRAEIDAGDTDAPIGAEGLNRPQRIATVKLSRFVWGGSGKASTVLEADFAIDPASPYDVDRDTLRAFVASF